jgi:hypothetical protein
MTLANPRIIVAALLVLAVHAAALIVSRSPVPAPIAAGLAIDLTVSATLAVYLLVVRPGLVRPRVLAPVIVAGLATARLALPDTSVRSALLAAGGVLELGLLGLLLHRVWRLGRRARGRGERESLLDVLEDGVRDLVPGRAGAIVAAEVAILCHAVAGWRRPAASPLRFTVHVEKGPALYSGVFVGLTVVEAVGLHLAVAPHAPVVAWVLTGLSAYGALWLIGDALALRHGGVRISDDGLRVDVGVRWRADLRWRDLERIERVDTRPEKADGTVDASIIEPTVALHLAAPVTVRGPFGIRRQARRLYLTVDDAARFCEVVASRSGAGG